MKVLPVKVIALYATFFASIPLALRAEISYKNNQYNQTRQQYLDVATSIAYGSDDNIYVAGYNWNPITYGDWYVISIDTTGIANWVYCYNGPANWQDMGYSIVYGGDSNIYSAGYSTHNPQNWDFTVINLTSAGDTNWIYRYDSPDDIESANSIIYGLDSNIYAGGYVEGNGYDMMIVSLAQSGDTNWTYRYNGSYNSDDVANSIVYGTDSNIYACGYTNGSGYDRDIFALSLTTSGDSNWTYTYNGSGNWADEVYSMAYGHDGNIYIAGYCTGNGTNKDLIILSLDSNGDTNWTYTYDGTAHGDDWASKITYGEDGNIYVAGSCKDINRNFIVMSLTSSGILNWNYIFDEATDDEASSVVYGLDGNIYAAGHSNWFVGVVISLTATGDTNWVNRYNLGIAGDRIYDITFGTNGNIYAAGMSEPTYDNSDLIVISITPQGTTNWIYQYDGNPGIEENVYSQHATERCVPFLIYPQPCSRSAMLVFNIPNTKYTSSLYLYDAAGRKQDVIWQRNCQLPTSFEYQLSDNLASGIYYLVLEVAGARYTKRLIVVR